jgi:hypothetical protein
MARSSDGSDSDLLFCCICLRHCGEEKAATLEQSVIGQGGGLDLSVSPSSIRQPRHIVSCAVYFSFSPEIHLAFGLIKVDGSQMLEWFSRKPLAVSGLSREIDATISN